MVNVKINYCLLSLSFMLRAVLLNPNNHYNHGSCNTFDYNHFIYSKKNLYTVTTSAHIIR